MTSVSQAVNALLSTSLDTKKDPILSGNKRVQLEIKSARNEKIAKREKKLERLVLRTKEHIVPDAATNSKQEKFLHKIATKGVVTLFNAVRKQQEYQREQEEASGSSIAKRSKLEKTAKSHFKGIMDAEKGRNESSEESESEQVKEQLWDVLDDDYIHNEAEMGDVLSD